MIYPQKLSSKKGEKILNISLILSIIVAIMLIVINKLTNPGIHWAALANCGIVYIWITVLYSIKKSTNIAGHVLIQTLAISALVLYIDKVLEFKGWSINIAIPIILIVANITMLILTILSYKKYIQYAVYQLMILIISMMPIVLIIKKIIEPQLLNQTSIIISMISLIITLSLCYKDVKETIKRRLHM